uniref:Putative secreted protein n=1 Tax=Anopheles darlingi TaxID=43151 RepID=A0A2M4D226_ANODA
MAQLFQHRITHARLIDITVVLATAVRASRCTTAALKARFVEVRLGNKNETLDRYQHLQKAGRMCVPLFFGPTVPRI